MTQPPAKSCDKKTKTAEMKLSKILHRIKSLKLSDSSVSKLSVPSRQHRLSAGPCVYVVFLGLILGSIGYYWSTELSSEHCLLALPASARPLLRAPAACAACAAVSGAARLANVTAEQFEPYAYGLTPVVVEDGARDWTAVETFTYDFFKRLYTTGNLGKQINDCFYFPYKSGLKSLQEVFSMDEGRVNLTGEPWYVGWSTCYSDETRVLRSHYNRPYFLPKTAESDMVDWIFMGGPGQGAHMHLQSFPSLVPRQVDSVRRVSWQAQVRGRKRWELAPPPECLYSCRAFAFDVRPGEILVVDTNRWYHRTRALPGGISVTIGAEYD